MAEFKLGQRWVSRSEPELGLGEIIEIADRRVSCAFRAADTVRLYAAADAPLVRVQFSPGDQIQTHDGESLTVSALTENNGLIFYQAAAEGPQKTLCETELSAKLQFSQPQDRLFLNQLDSNDAFNLRYLSLKAQAALDRQPFRGLLGPRTALLPHQLFVAQQVAENATLRALLADEVGLGKTIEAGLILSKMLHTGRGERVLILVPETLKIQWLVEMVRRFNLEFTLLDEAQCVALESQHTAQQPDKDLSPEMVFAPEAATAPNPFESQQLFIADFGLFTHNPIRIEQALAAHWDMLIVDEAHHLKWGVDHVSPEYRIAERLAKRAKGLLLLSATPEQFGQEGHFARLRLIDPDRYPSLEAYQSEQAAYQALAALITTWQAGDEGHEAARSALLEQLGQSDPISDTDMRNKLLDQFGPGFTLYRNRRQAVVTQPQRRIEPVYLTNATKRSEIETPAEDQRSIQLKLQWLGALLASSSEKYLVICREAALAIAIEKRLRLDFGVKSSCFHEGLDLIARDRAAAFFSDPEYGAQVLICSEIGSEGRNFQFAHHLVMFDLPESGDLIEQRIGRLDRIGQTGVVTIHIPLLQDTADQVRFHWYHEGLDLFARPNPAAAEIERRWRSKFFEVMATPDYETFVAESRNAVLDLEQTLEAGRDRLLEMASFDRKTGEQLKEAVSNAAMSQSLVEYLSASFNYFGLADEPLTDDIHLVKPTAELQSHNLAAHDNMRYLQYPELPESGVAYTFRRETALIHEDVQFITWEHPLVSQALDRVLSEQLGNAAVTLIKRPAFPSGTLLLEALFRADCTAPRWLGLQQHIQHPLLRLVIGPDLQDLTEALPFHTFTDAIPAKPDPIARLIGLKRSNIQAMLRRATELATQQVETDRELAIADYTAQTLARHDRLQDLSARNPNLSTSNAALVLTEQRTGLTYLGELNPRLDAVRVIITV